MLGCTFIEVLTGCSREPYDWLMEDDPSGMSLIVYRGQESTRNNNPLVVRSIFTHRHFVHISVMCVRMY